MLLISFLCFVIFICAINSVHICCGAQLYIFHKQDEFANVYLLSYCLDLNLLSAKKADDKIMSANFGTTFNINCITLKNQMQD